MPTPIPSLEPGEIDTRVELNQTTMGALGDVLPLGLFIDDGRHRDLTWHPPTMGTRKRLGGLRGRKDLEGSPGRFVSYWLATALKSIGGLELASMKVERAALLTGQLCVSDVIYAVLRWQVAARPDGLPLRGRGCGVCGASWDQVNVDLASLEVTELPGVDQDGEAYGPDHLPVARVGLLRGLPFQEGTIQTLLLKPPSWVDSMGKLVDRQLSNQALRAALTIRGSICGTDAGPRTLPLAVLDELWPEDERLIDQALEKIVPTPNLEIAVPCPECGAENADILDWQDPGFFA